MKGKRILALLMAAAMLLSLSACDLSRFLPDTDTDTGTYQDPVSGPETDTGSETESAPETKTETEEDTKTETETATEPESGSETESESETDTDSTVDIYTDPEGYNPIITSLSDLPPLLASVQDGGRDGAGGDQ